MNHSFFIGSHQDISGQWPELRAHGNAIGLFINLSIELEQLVFDGGFEKIYKVHSVDVQLRVSLNQFCIVSSKGTLVNSAETSYDIGISPVLICTTP